MENRGRKDGKPRRTLSLDGDGARLAKLLTTRNKVRWVLVSLLLQSELQTGADGEQGW